MPTAAQHDRRYERLKRLLRQVREEAGLTQRALGDLMDQPQSWIHNSETGNRRVDIAEFCRWCRACGVDPLEVLSRYLGRKWPPSG